MEAKRVVWLIVVMFCFCLISDIAQAKTVFVAERHEHKITVFDANDFILSHLETIDYGHTEEVYGLGPIDLAADEKHNTLFVSFETYSQLKPGSIAPANILLINTKTLEVIDTIEIEQAVDIAGLYYDASRRILYAVERNTNIVYEIAWDPSEPTLTLKRAIPLTNIDWACAIVVDGNLAYVSEYHYGFIMKYQNHIKVYDISNNWSYVKTIPMGAKTTSFVYDSQRDTFYSGAYNYEGTYHHLAKHEMDPNDMFVKDIETCVIDADVDEDSGYVFVTTYRDNSSWQDPNGTLEIWDTSGWTHDPNQVITSVDSISEHIAGPAGVLCLDSTVRPDVIDVSKTDGLSGASVLPGNTFTYTITVDPDEYDHDWVEVVDYLPPGVEYDYIISPSPPVFDPNYDSATHSYTWQLGPLDATGDPVELTLTVTVIDAAEPLGMLVNFVTAESNVAYDQYYFETPVGDFGGDVVYVDASAPAGGNGTSWDRAYNYLQDGIARAELMNNDSDDIEIWVAEGVYKPEVSAADDAFEIPEEVDVYGGYAGYGAADPNERDLERYQTTLSGYILVDRNGSVQRNNTVVEMGDNSLIDGFTVEEGNWRGIDGSSISSQIINCLIKSNVDIGVYCLNGNLTLQWCEIKENKEQGIYHFGSGYSLTVENCNIHHNQRDGIYTDQSTSTILNSMINQNGSGSTTSSHYYGINLVYPTGQVTLSNNTIVYNINAGIKYANYTYRPKPKVKNCIVFGNDRQDGYIDLDGISSSWHCCFTDPSNPDAPITNPSQDDNGNIYTHPGFAYPDYTLGNFHLAYDSPCVNVGDPNETDAAELDIDGDARENGTVDMGADEMVACTGEPNSIYNAMDLTADGVVNLGDYSLFAKAWLSHDPNDPTMTTDPNFINEPNYVDSKLLLNWNRLCNVDTTGDSEFVIDLADLIEWLDNDWLWVACWRHDLQDMMAQQSAASSSMMMGDSMMAMSLDSTLAASVEEEKTYAEMTDFEVNSLVVGVYEILDSIEISIENGHENAENLLEAKEFLEEVLADIKASRE